MSDTSVPSLPEPELPPLPATQLRFQVELTPTGERLDYTARDMNARYVEGYEAGRSAGRASAEPDGVRAGAEGADEGDGRRRRLRCDDETPVLPETPAPPREVLELLCAMRLHWSGSIDGVMMRCDHCKAAKYSLVFPGKILYQREGV